MRLHPVIVLDAAVVPAARHGGQECDVLIKVMTEARPVTLAPPPTEGSLPGSRS
jgi:hypothetical protein